MQIWPPEGVEGCKVWRPSERIFIFSQRPPQSSLLPSFCFSLFSFLFLNLAYLAYPPQSIYTLTPKYLVCIVASTSLFKPPHPFIYIFYFLLKEKIRDQKST